MASEQERQALKERFHKVILGAGYNETAAEGIMAEWFEKYLTNIPEFVQMLEEYEQESRIRRIGEAGIDIL